MTLERADRLSRRFMAAAVAFVAISGATWMIGFRQFSMPLAVTAWLLLTRNVHWNGWISGYKAARKTYLEEEQP